jgi:two-component system, OmpR family, heavy metal sensor histidine kinase CusS
VFARSLDGVNTFGFSIMSADSARPPKSEAGHAKDAQLASRPMASAPLKSP